MFFKKGNKIHELLISQIDKCVECYETFTKYIEDIEDSTSLDELISMSKKISDLESEADNTRRIITRELLGGALLAGTRRDIKLLIEIIDKIPNKCEEIIKQIMLQNVRFTEDIKKIIVNINSITKEQLDLLKKLIDSIFIDLSNSYDLHLELENIEKIESRVDDLESEAIRLLFISNSELAYKNQIKHFITYFAEVSDIIEDISDNLEMIMVMRKV